MDTQSTAPSSLNLLKKIVWAILIALGIIVILFILATVYSNFRKNSMVYNTSDMGYGFASEASLGSPSFLGGLTQQKAVSDEAYAPPSPAIPGNTAAPIEQKIIKTGSLDITVEDVEQAVTKISNEVSLNNGYVQNSTLSEGRNGQKSANLIIRVPAISFENTIAQVKNLAQVVTRENINGREVTEEYVDLQTNLTHNQAVEQQYLELLSRAQKVEEIIAVREKLDQVQGEIERLKGRMRYLDNQTELSTININITSEVKVTLPADKWQPWEVVKSSARNLIISLQNFVNFFIGLIFFLIAVIPYLILILIIYLPARWMYKRHQKKKQVI